MGTDLTAGELDLMRDTLALDDADDAADGARARADRRASRRLRGWRSRRRVPDVRQRVVLWIGTDDLVLRQLELYGADAADPEAHPAERGALRRPRAGAGRVEVENPGAGTRSIFERRRGRVRRRLSGRRLQPAAAGVARPGREACARCRRRRGRPRSRTVARWWSTASRCGVRRDERRRARALLVGRRAPAGGTLSVRGRSRALRRRARRLAARAGGLRRRAAARLRFVADAHGKPRLLAAPGAAFQRHAHRRSWRSSRWWRGARSGSTSSASRPIATSTRSRAVLLAGASARRSIVCRLGTRAAVPRAAGAGRRPTSRRAVTGSASPLDSFDVAVDPPARGPARCCSRPARAPATRRRGTSATSTSARDTWPRSPFAVGSAGYGR